MTSAPKSDSTVAAAGAAMKLAQSITFRPSKIPFSIVAPLRAVYWSCRDIARAIPFKRHLDHVGGAMQLLPAGHQSCIPACRVGIDRHGLFGGEARQIMRPTGLRSGAGQTVAAERLHADDG